jgi:hypothetical protein
VCFGIAVRNAEAKLGMKHPARPLRWLALVLMRCATQLVPTTRADWAKAMHAELDRLEDDRDAFEWAFGCVVAGFKERANVMFVGNLKISSWVLAPEMLLCFVPLTMSWLDAIGGESGIVRLNMDIIQKYFIAVRGGTIELVVMIAGAILGALGPVGLLAAFRLIVLGLPMRSPWLRSALVFGPIVCGVLTIVARLAIGGTAAFSFRSVDAFDFSSGIFLLSALPALGAVHMLRLGPPSSGGSAVP